MNIFAFYRECERLVRDWTAPIARPVRTESAPIFFNSIRGRKEKPAGISWSRPKFIPTHIHVRTGKEYMLTANGARLEVTGDEAYPLAEYEDADGKSYAQKAERFHDGRFKELVV